MSAPVQVKVGLLGCDDETFFTMEVSPDEFAFLTRMVTLAAESSQCDCMPVMSVEIEGGAT